jgi:hypothetical protein
VLCFLRCSGLPPDANALPLTRRHVWLHLITDDSWQRCVSGDVALGPSFPASTLLFPRGGAHKKGENPKWVGGMPTGDGLGRRLYTLSQGSARAKEYITLQDWAIGRNWRCGRLPMAATAPVASPAGAKGAFLLANRPSAWAVSSAVWLGVRASLRPAIPSRANTISAGRRGRRGGKR